MAAIIGTDMAVTGGNYCRDRWINMAAAGVVVPSNHSAGPGVAAPADDFHVSELRTRINNHNPEN